MNLFDTHKEVKKSKVPDIVHKLGLAYEIFINDKEYEDLTHSQEVFKGSRVILHKILKNYSNREYNGYALKKLEYYPKELPLQILNTLDEFYNKYYRTIEKNKDVNHFYILAPYRNFTKSGLAKPSNICIVYSYFNVYIEVWNGDIDIEDLTFKESFKSIFYNFWDNFKEIFEDLFVIKKSYFLKPLLLLSGLISFTNIILFNKTENIPDQVLIYIVFNLLSIVPIIIYIAITLSEKYIKPFKYVMFILGYAILLNALFLKYKWPKLEGIHNWEDNNYNNVKVRIYKDKPLRWDKIK